MTEPVGSIKQGPPEQDASTRFHHDLIIQALVDQSPIGIQVFTADGRSIATNRALRAMLGLGDRDAEPEPMSLLEGPLAVVVSSGWSAVEVGPHLERHPGVRFLQKPYQAEALVAAFAE